MLDCVTVFGAWEEPLGNSILEHYESAWMPCQGPSSLSLQLIGAFCIMPQAASVSASSSNKVVRMVISVGCDFAGEVILRVSTHDYVIHCMNF